MVTLSHQLRRLEHIDPGGAASGAEVDLGVVTVDGVGKPAELTDLTHVD